MPLSDEEQRLLQQMEQALAAEDPKFASALRGSTLRARLRRAVIASALGFVAGVVMLMYGVIRPLTAVSVIGFLVMLACAYVFVTSWRRGGEVTNDEQADPTDPKQRAGRAPAQAPPHSSFMDRIEERWRRRRDEGP